MSEIIVTEKISKNYKDVQAVSEVSLSIRKGEIYGFLGLNGAGKTTTIRMLLGMISPSSGRIFIDGKKASVSNYDLWKRVGYLVEMPFSYPNLTVRENLEVVRRLRNLKDRSLPDQIIEKLRLQAYKYRIAKNLSLGNAQRLGLAKALMHNPEILFLDEPTNGLDPAGIFEIRELLLDLAEKHGVTIFISSHILEEISKIATRIGIIHEGRLIQEVDAERLSKIRQKRLLVDARDRMKIAKILTDNNYTFNNAQDGSIVFFDEKIINEPDMLASLLVNAGCPPTLLQVTEENLESYFFRTIGLKGDTL